MYNQVESISHIKPLLKIILLLKLRLECFHVLPVYLWFFLKAGETLNYVSQTFLRNVIIYFGLNGNLLLRLLCPGFDACLLSRLYLHIKVFLYSWLLHNPGKKNRLHLQVIPASQRKKMATLKQLYVNLWASLIAQLVKNLPAMQETPVQFLGRERDKLPTRYA